MTGFYRSKKSVKEVGISVLAVVVALAILVGGIYVLVRFQIENKNKGPRKNGWEGSTCSQPDYQIIVESSSVMIQKKNDTNSTNDTSSSTGSSSTSTPAPTTSPTILTTSPSLAPITDLENEEIIVLQSGEQLLTNQGVSSPNGRFCVELTNTGDLVLSMVVGTTRRNNSTNNTNKKVVLWQEDSSKYNKVVPTILSMQEDGNLVYKVASSRVVLWKSGTGSETGATLRLDNRGRLSVISRDGITPLWVEGIPQGKHTTNNDNNRVSLTLPIRGMFYYPWFPETWSVDGNPVFYHPTFGKYSSGNRTVQQFHIRSMEYAHVDLAIASWWGPGAKNDRARIINLMDRSLESSNSSSSSTSSGQMVKWSIYHEQERRQSMDVSELKADLAYLKEWFVWHEAYGYINNKPTIFVYNADGCDVAKRWVDASACEWYIVLKVFSGYRDCPYQPDGWHEYGPSSGFIHTKGFAASVSAGFWNADEATPRLPRLSKEAFQSDVQAMVQTGEPLQLISTFNEWGEGTALESADEWASTSGHGIYMDVLHDIV